MTVRNALLFATAVTLSACGAATPEEDIDQTTGELQTAKLRELSCDGTSSVDSSRATLRYDGGNTVDVTVDRSVCTFVFSVPTGCVPQHNRVTLPILRKSITASRVKLVLDNDGTDLDIDLSTKDRTGTWFAHENRYTYDLSCDTLAVDSAG